MSAGTPDSCEADESTVHSPPYESLVYETIKDGGDSCVGVLGKHVSDIAPSQLSVVSLPKDVHDSSFELPELGCSTGAGRATAWLARAHRIAAGRRLSHLPTSDIRRRGLPNLGVARTSTSGQPELLPRSHSTMRRHLPAYDLRRIRWRRIRWRLGAFPPVDTLEEGCRSIRSIEVFSQ